MSKPAYDPVTKIWSGPKVPPLYNPNQGLGHLILRILQQTPDFVTQISADTGVSVTCKEMYDRSLKLTKYLKEFNMNQGDVIGIVATNTENLAPVVFACFILGYPINPLAPIMNESDIVQMYSKTKPKMIFCDAGNLIVVQNAVSEMKSDAKILTVMDIVDGYDCVNDILKEIRNENWEDFEFPIINPNSTAAILCSSGSTGFPKGICKSHKQIISDFHQLWGPSYSNIICFQGSPIFWISGFATLIIAIFYKCARVTMSARYDAKILIDIVNKHNINFLFVPPFMLVAFLKLENLKPLKSIQYLVIGSAVVSDLLCQKFKPYIPNGKIICAYGCTEQDFLAVNYSDKNYGSSGFVLNNAEIKITDDSGKSLGPNEKGEICTKIPVHFTEYFNEPEKTAEAFDGDWFKTGDIGYFDDHGYIYVIDRKKELLKYQGYHVTPSEIEAIINSIKGVASSCVVGVAEPHTGNDIVHAFVILEGKSVLTKDYILDYVNGKVIDVKKIRGGVHFVENFPLGLTGKVDKLKMKSVAQTIYENALK